MGGVTRWYRIHTCPYVIIMSLASLSSAGCSQATEKADVGNHTTVEKSPGSQDEGESDQDAVASRLVALNSEEMDSLVLRFRQATKVPESSNEYSAVRNAVLATEERVIENVTEIRSVKDDMYFAKAFGPGYAYIFVVRMHEKNAKVMRYHILWLS